jgi:regulator of sirC expression with transglutaminase-like and TPR domain
LEAQGDNDRANADFNRAIRLKPDYAAPYSGRAWLLLKVGKAEEARSDADKGVSLDAADADSRDTRGHILLTLGNAAAALDDFNEALRLRADSISSLWGRGQAYEQQGLRSLALADYKKAIELKAMGPKATGAQNKARARLIVLESPTAPVQASNVAQKPKTAMGRRVALVIGNGAYKAVAQLPNPKNDASAVAGELTRLGFEVIEKHDLGVAAMRKVLGEFEDKTAGAEWALVYYAGHGMELDGKNWLIPVDAELLRATDTPDEAIPLDRVLARLNAASKLRIVVLDACRNNPFLARMVMNRISMRSVARGLTAVEPSHGEVVFYAARDGSVALDGTGSNSPFASALIKHMDEDGVELGRFFRRVTSSVLATTGNQQEPFVYGRIPDEDFYFKPPR